MRTYDFSANELGLVDKDLKAAPATEYTGTILDAAEFTTWLVTCHVTITGSPNAGSFRFGVNLYTKDEVLIGNVDLLAGVSSQVTQVEGVTLGRSFDPVKTRGSTASTMPSNLAMLRLASKIQFYIAVQASSNATTAVASLRAFAQGG